MGVSGSTAGFVSKRPFAYVATVKVREGVKAGRTLTLVVDARSSVDGGDYKGIVVFVVCNSALGTRLSVELLHESEDSAEKERLRAERKKEQKEREAQRAEDRKQGRKVGREEEKIASERKRRAYESRQMMKETEESSQPTHLRLTPIYQSPQIGARRPLELLVSRWDSTGRLILAQFKARTLDSRPFHVSFARARLKGSGAGLPAEITAVNRPSANPDAIATIEPSQELHGVIALSVRSGERLEELSHIIELVDEKAQRCLSVVLRGWRSRDFSLTLTPKEEWEKEVEAAQAREARGKQLIIGPRAVSGAFWLSNGLEPGQGRKLGSTTFVGGGMRLIKGFAESFAFEAEVVGGKTGETTIDGNTRQASFGRLQVGGVLRFGDTVAPIVRIGLALQGVSYSSGSGDSSEVGLLLNVGGGVVARLTNDLVGGMSVGVVAPTGADELRTLEVGGFIGYGWNP